MPQVKTMDKNILKTSCTDAYSFYYSYNLLILTIKSLFLYILHLNKHFSTSVIHHPPYEPQKHTLNHPVHKLALFLMNKSIINYVVGYPIDAVPIQILPALTSFECSLDLDQVDVSISIYHANRENELRH